MSPRNCQSGRNQDALQQKQGPTEQRGCGEEDQGGGQESAPPEAVLLSWRPGKQLRSRAFMSIMEDCIPKAQLPNRRNLPG